MLFHIKSVASLGLSQFVLGKNISLFSCAHSYTPTYTWETSVKAIKTTQKFRNGRGGCLSGLCVFLSLTPVLSNTVVILFAS